MRAAAPTITSMVYESLGARGLDVRLAPLSPGREWQFRSGSDSGVVSVRPGSTAPVAEATEADGRVQVFRFVAAAPGWSDLRFEHGIIKMTVRAKVE